MRFAQKVAAAVSLARVRLQDAHVPVAVRINLNNRCHSRCQYCGFWSSPVEELPTAQWLRIVDELAKLGTVHVCFSGGEPMLRDDIGALIQRAVELGISPSMNSTGILFARHQSRLRGLDLVKLSLDGRPETHDHLAGRKGSFRELTEAIEVSRQLGLRFSFAFTITRFNLDDIPWVLDFANSHQTFVAFQPLMPHQHASADVRTLYPERPDYLRAIDLLTSEKRRGSKSIRNSVAALEHVRSWPHISGLKCWGGHVFLMIEPNGDVVPCDRIPYDTPIPNVQDHDVASALEHLPQKNCHGCGFCGALELNMVMNGRWSALPTMSRVAGPSTSRVLAAAARLTKRGAVREPAGVPAGRSAET